jgi:sec-independent protein translocase protein TatB
MFDIGFWEVALISVLALIVIGPERLPQVARTVGHWIGRARKYIEGVKNEVEKEFDTAELKRMLHNQEVQIRELQGKINRPLDLSPESQQHAENKIEPPSEPQYEIIEEEPLPQELPVHSHGTEIAPANNASDTVQPASEKDKPA